jgi:hypothetical protein
MNKFIFYEPDTIFYFLIYQKSLKIPFLISSLLSFPSLLESNVLKVCANYWRSLSRVWWDPIKSNTAY